jgi:mono/diheme cytochrome c family protein
MRFLAVVGALAIVVALALGIFFFGGFYSVAASSEDPRWLDWMLVKVRMASIDRHARDTPPIRIDDPAQVQTGARAYATRGCVTCHGAPGVEWAKFSEGLRPYPPDLKEIVPDLEPRHLFWVVKNGIKMTGMPGFGLIEVPDPELWTIVAFLKKLPELSEADYKAWTAQDAPAAPAPAPAR